MIEGMAILYMSEAEVARNLHAVLAKVQQGIEIVIEQDHLPVAVLKTPSTSKTGAGRKLSASPWQEPMKKSSVMSPSRMLNLLEMCRQALMSVETHSNRLHGISPRLQHADRGGA